MAPRLAVILQGAAVVAVALLALKYGFALAPHPATDDTAARLAFAGAWLVVPGLVLLVSVLTVSIGRFVTDDAFDGKRTPASRFIEINLRALQNTLEQVVLAAIAWIGLAIALPAGCLGVIPVLAVLFVVGRVAFWAGYQLHPTARAFGFALTMLPTATALLWLGWWAVGS